MITMTLEEICQAVNGLLLSGEAGMVIDGVSTDTRKLVPGTIFVALVGPRFDGHEFVDLAIKAGAAALMVSRPVELPGNIPVLQVTDTLVALQNLARYNRKKWGRTIVGITGSNGKTSTKDLISAVLSTRMTVLKTQGNFNNEVGLPLTLLELTDQHHVGVIEMGMRALGEISLLAQIALPDIGVITNVGETHLERLSTIENIAMAKGELLDYIQLEGVAILNGDDPWVRSQSTRYQGEKIFYGFSSENNLRVVNSDPTEDGGALFTVNWQSAEHRFALNIPGQHNILNALAAVATGRYLGLSWEDIALGLANAELTGMRLQLLKLANGIIINDAYNANPASAKAALRVLQETGKGNRRIAVMGSMFELGQREEAGHQEVGQAAARTADYLITVGDLGKYIAQGAADAGMLPEAIYSFGSNPEVITYLESFVRAGDVLLVKGSRGMKLEEVVAGLENILN